MVDFNQAINTAKDNAKALIPGAQNYVLEGVELSSDGKVYEVSLSYDFQGGDTSSGGEVNKGETNNGLSQLIKVLSYRREYKIFLVDSDTGQFKGFRRQSAR